jgi:hypothetical protein
MPLPTPHWCVRGLAAALLLALCACAPTYSAFEIDRRLSKTLGAAQFHIGVREVVEAGQLALAIERIDADYPGLAEVKSQLGIQVEDLFATRSIGSNRARRYTVERSLGARVALYLPDRILDFFDIVTFDVHAGPGAFADFHVTRAVQASAGGRVVGGIGLLPQRTLPGFQLQADVGAQVFGVGDQRFVGFLSGPSGLFSGAANLRGPHSPNDRFYQDFRDYWAIGGSATLAFAGAGAELHLVQAADFLLGFAGIDVCNDDRARTRGLNLLTSERDLLQELARIESTPELMREYERNREELHAPVRQGQPSGASSPQ